MQKSNRRSFLKALSVVAIAPALPTLPTEKLTLSVVTKSNADMNIGVERLRVLSNGTHIFFADELLKYIN